MRIAAIDQGTTSTRVLAVEDDGTAAILRSIRHEQHYPRSGWVEHDPGELLQNIRLCLEPIGKVAALAIANQGESCLAWDRLTGQPLSPVIVWNDGRTASTVTRLREDGADELTLQRAGLPLDPYFSATKLRWLIDNISDVRDALRQSRLRMGTTDAYFLDRLCGVFATDVTTASRTSLMNIESMEWDPRLCEMFGIPIEILPEIRSTVGYFGSIASVPVCASVVDQQAALRGHNCLRPGDTKITFGTGAFALAHTGNRIVRAPRGGLLPTIAWRIKDETSYALEGGVYDAGAAVDWARRLGLFRDPMELDAFDSGPAIARGLAFVPALSGLAAPHWDRNAAAIWIGMTADTTSQDLCQALLEGIALCACDLVSEMDRCIEISEEISVDGAVSRSSYLVQFLADILDRRIRRCDFDELTALGAADLAAAALGSGVPVQMRSTTEFLPRQSAHQEWTSIFHEAIARSKQWRSTVQVEKE